MKKRSLDDFLNPERRSHLFKQQLLLRSDLPPQEKRRSYKKRSPEETFLLMIAIEKDVRLLETEGVLEKNGRKWKLHI